MQKITPHLWFNDRAEEAANFYVSIFKDSKIKRITHYGAGAANAAERPKGSVMTVTFEIEGQEIMGLNGGPHFKFTPAISLFVKCETQEEVDTLWEKLSKDGEKVQCGWLTDKFGVSWQIVPRILIDMLEDKNRRKRENVMQALLKMKKLDIQTLKQAYEG